MKAEIKSNKTPNGNIKYQIPGVGELYAQKHNPGRWVFSLNGNEIGCGTRPTDGIKLAREWTNK